MTTAYPEAIDQWENKQDNIDTFYAEYINALHERIIKVEAVLGINPQGIFESVADRLASFTY